VSVDLVCGDPAFVDLTFADLDGLPGPGEERHARDFLRSPGGGASVAIGAARLGLSVALAGPLGADADGDFLRAALHAEGVSCAARTVARTPVTAVMPWAGERAMATFHPRDPLLQEDVAAWSPCAVVLSLPYIDAAPAGVPLYVTAGDAEARAVGQELPGVLAGAGAHALIVNAREAQLLSGERDPVAAARALAADQTGVVVTLGPDGALSVRDGALERVPGVPVDAVDTTGAGDLFAATYVWAELGGATPAQRLQWACLAAALSVRVPTAVAGAQSILELATAGRERGLALPARASMKILGGSV
jgi:sugar/nucleoside kinase (ribokinase family)